jgi:hypothetical protein
MLTSYWVAVQLVASRVDVSPIEVVSGRRTKWTQSHPTPRNLKKKLMQFKYRSHDGRSYSRHTDTNEGKLSLPMLHNHAMKVPAKWDEEIELHKTGACLQRRDVHVKFSENVSFGSKVTRGGRYVHKTYSSCLFFLSFWQKQDEHGARAVLTTASSDRDRPYVTRQHNGRKCPTHKWQYSWYLLFRDHATRLAPRFTDFYLHRVVTCDDIKFGFKATEELNLGCLHPVARVISYDMGFNPSTQL